MTENGALHPLTVVPLLKCGCLVGRPSQLAFADCAGESCTCDPLFTTEIVRWSPETFAALDVHPCTDPDAEDGRCRGIDSGF